MQRSLQGIDAGAAAYAGQDDRITHAAIDLRFGIDHAWIDQVDLRDADQHRQVFGLGNGQVTVSRPQVEPGRAAASIGMSLVDIGRDDLFDLLRARGWAYEAVRARLNAGDHAGPVWRSDVLDPVANGNRVEYGQTTYGLHPAMPHRRAVGGGVDQILAQFAR